MIYKSRVYIKNPSDAPQGVKVEEGVRGGHYYESNENKEPEQENKEPKQENNYWWKPIDNRIESLYHNVRIIFNGSESDNNFQNTYSDDQLQDAIDKIPKEHLKYIKYVLLRPEISGKGEEGYTFGGTESNSGIIQIFRGINLYEYGTSFEEQFAHEVGHIVAVHLFGSEYPDVEWENISFSEPFGTKRARLNLAEDFAESYSAYINNELDINDYPQRYKKLKELINKNIQKARVYIKNPSESPQGVKVEEGKRGGHYYESDQIEQYKEPENNIEIITGDIKDNNILDSLEEFSKEGDINAMSPPTKEEIKRLVDISGIDKNIKVIAIPYWSESTHAYTYLGTDTIYLLAYNSKMDQDILNKTRAACYKVGYDITNMTLENRKLGTLIHEEVHIKTYHKAGITATSKNDEESLHFTFRAYEQYIKQHLKAENNASFDYIVLLELIAEDGRINHNGHGSEYPHRYFYVEDKQDPQFKKERANILKRMGMI